MQTSVQRYRGHDGKPSANHAFSVLFVFLAATPLGCDSSGSAAVEAPACLAESVSAGWHSTWVTAPDHSVWMFGVGGGDSTYNGPGQRLPAIVPPVRQDWIPADTIALDGRSDIACIVGADHRLRCEIPPSIRMMPTYLYDVTETWTGPWTTSPVYSQKRDGSVWCCDPYDAMNTENKDLGRDVTAMAVGDHQACALKQDGSVWCLGAGYLGDGQGEYPEAVPQPPRQVPLPATAVALAAGLVQTCVALTDGNVWCWGPSRTDPGLSPFRIDIADVKILAMGALHVCAMKGDGSVWCWGDNSFGQLGHPPFGSPSGTAAQVAGLGNDVTGISIGYQHSCARKADGTVWCWGNSGFGQLGSNKVGVTELVVLRGCGDAQLR